MGLGSSFTAKNKVVEVALFIQYLAVTFTICILVVALALSYSGPMTCVSCANEVAQQGLGCLICRTQINMVLRTYDCKYCRINWLKPNSITLASSELAPNMFGASSEL